MDEIPRKVVPMPDNQRDGAEPHDEGLLSLEFSSELLVSSERVWGRATTMAGVNAELAPLLRMSFPPQYSRIEADEVPLGTPLFASWVLLFGVLPIDRHLLTIAEIGPGRRFLESSRSLLQRRWNHERVVEETEGGCRVIDRLSFQPRRALPRWLVRWVVRLLFQHRHRQLRRNFVH